MYKRINTKPVKVGGIVIGGGHPVSIQTMTNTDTWNTYATIRQIHELEREGCEIIRVAVPDMRSAEALAEIKKNISIPLVADIHFDYRLALKALENGVDKLRINPGNIGDAGKIRLVVEKAKERGVPIRIGVNSGSVEKHLLTHDSKVTPDILCGSAMSHVRILEELDFRDIIISIKSSSAALCIEAYKMLAEKTEYPLHVGVTESGTLFAGSIKSAVGIGALLAMGIGDTIRVSLTCDPVEEIRCAKEILKGLELRKFGVEIVSCPTCGRSEIDVIGLAGQIENACRYIKKDIKVSIMGCVVNGPGEAREANLGVTGGSGGAVIYKDGSVLRIVNKNDVFDELMKEIELYGEESEAN